MTCLCHLLYHNKRASPRLISLMRLAEKHNFPNSAWQLIREDIADGAMPGVSPQRPNRAPKPGCEGQGLTNAKATAQ